VKGQDVFNFTFPAILLKQLQSFFAFLVLVSCKPIITEWGDFYLFIAEFFAT
jgi:hypothetical protein